MKFIKDKWTKKDISELENFLSSNARIDKIEWTKSITQTSKKTYAIESPIIKKIAKEIVQGNYKNFLDNCTFSSHEMTLIYGYILNFEKDYNSFINYLQIYLKHIDCWATCDILNPIVKKHKVELFEFAKKLTKDKQTFTRRAGLKLMFSYTSDPQYSQEIFNILNSFYQEEEYYVNMIVAWLFCEMFIKQRTATFKFLQSHKLNSFTINKGIQKCRDSFRVSKEDKITLAQYKQL